MNCRIRLNNINSILKHKRNDGMDILQKLYAKSAQKR